jgi:hypothetical protein
VDYLQKAQLSLTMAAVMVKISKELVDRGLCISAQVGDLIPTDQAIKKF